MGYRMALVPVVAQPCVKGMESGREGGLTAVLFYTHNPRMMGLFGTANQVIVCLTDAKATQRSVCPV